MLQNVQNYTRIFTSWEPFVHPDWCSGTANFAIASYSVRINELWLCSISYLAPCWEVQQPVCPISCIGTNVCYCRGWVSCFTKKKNRSEDYLRLKKGFVMPFGPFFEFGEWARASHSVLLVELNSCSSEQQTSVYIMAWAVASTGGAGGSVAGPSQIEHQSRKKAKR